MAVDDRLFTDYGEKDNTDLAERFGVKVTDDYKDHPVIKLFVQGNDINTPIDYDGDYSVDNLRKFVATEGGTTQGLRFSIIGFGVGLLSAAAPNELLHCIREYSGNTEFVAVEEHPMSVLC
jgi:hypothetical protein